MDFRNLDCPCFSPLTPGQVYANSSIPINPAVDESARNVSRSTVFFNRSSTSSSATTTKKIPHCVSLKKFSLTRHGYKSFQDWNSDPSHIYIGRNMSHHVTEAVASHTPSCSCIHPLVGIHCNCLNNGSYQVGA